MENHQQKVKNIYESFSLEELKALSRNISNHIPYLKMLVLFGSRARGDNLENSDWDFAVLYDEKKRDICCQNDAFAYFKVPRILTNMFNLDESIDVIDLNNCSTRIADRIATDGKLIYETQKGLFDKFKQKSILTDEQKKQIRKRLKEEINDFLKENRELIT